jgi:AcrR family transcriptional regulator
MSAAALSLRERKSAKLKLLILSTTQEALKKQNFTDIHVNDICKLVGISKVTFFRYFPQKEDVLLYLLRIWAFRTSIHLQNVGLKGIKAVNYIFDQYGNLCEKHPSLMLHLIKYYAVTDIIIKPISIKKAEKHFLFPSHENIIDFEILSFEKLLEKHILEAIFDTELTRTSDVNDLVSMLLTTTYGSIVVSKLKQLPLKGLIKKNTTSIINSFM